jgi:MOSC domain-containing protein YiiM
MAELYSIVYKPERDDRVELYVRVPLQQANLVAGYGIEGDTKGGHPKRQLNIMSYEMLQVLKSEGFDIEPGSMGEQIVIKGMDIDSLQPGTQIKIGDSAVVEIGKPRTGCEKFELVQNQSPKKVQNRMGMMARVIVSGEIRVGDPVSEVVPV